jgi:hypothetical protein
MCRFGSLIREERVMSCGLCTACIAHHLEPPDWRGRSGSSHVTHMNGQQEAKEGDSDPLPD